MADYYVNTAYDGSQGASDGSATKPWTNLQAALNGMAYNTVRVCYCTGTETLSSTLQLKASGSAGSGYGECTLIGCGWSGTFANPTYTSYQPGAGWYTVNGAAVTNNLDVNGKGNWVFRNILFNGATADVVTNASATSAGVMYFGDCQFNNSGAGYGFGNGSGGGFTGGLIFVRGAFKTNGLYGMNAGYYTFLDGCVFSGNASGAITSTTSHLNIENCLLQGSNATPKVGTALNLPSGSSYSKISHSVLDGFATAISLGTVTRVTMVYNRITTNTTGIYSSQSSGYAYGNYEGSNYFSGNTTDIAAAACYSIGTSLLNQGSTGYGTGFMLASTATMRRAAVSFDGTTSVYLTSGLTAPDFAVVDPSFVLTGHDNYTGGAAGTLTLPSGGTKILTSEAAFGVVGSLITPSATLPNSQYVLSSAPDYGVGGTGGAKTATIPSGANVQSGAAAFGINGTSETPSYPMAAVSKAEQLATDQAAVTAAAASILTTATILGVTGTFDRLAWEASRNTDPGISRVTAGTSYLIRGASLTGTASTGGGGWMVEDAEAWSVE